MNKNFPTDTVTFLFTDIEGSTSLAQEFAETWETLRDHHNTILQTAIESQRGYVFRIIGDAFCAAFPTATDALRAALRSQRELQAKAWEGPPIRVRMGIHTGPAEIQTDGEYRGYLTLTRVQRVMSAAHGGQVLLSSATAALVRSDLPEHTSLLDLGEHRLKGLEGLERLWQVVAPDLPQRFPPIQTLNEHPHNLPVPLTSFIGRAKELEVVKAELARHRLVTLTGPGGIGKTRMSLQVASQLVDGFQHGAWFVELEHVREPAQVPASIAQALHLQELPGRTMIETLKDYLREKELLLVLDNFEQVVDAAPVVKELLLAAARLKIMVSSRTPLRIAGEVEVRVPLLSLPDDDKGLPLDQLAELESVQLFIERARSAKSDFVLTSENAPAVAETCQRLDGLPLAIELAAARVRLLPPQKMLRQLDDRLRFLTSSARDIPARQQTLRAAIGWSYDLLTPPEQSLFRRLAIFLGGATLEAIEEVCRVEDLDLLTGLESLLEKSLLQLTEEGGEVRYDMLETIRAFADEKLVNSGEADQMQEQYLLYFHRLAHEAEPELVGPQELNWIRRLTDEHRNLQAAIVWGLGHDLGRAIEMLCDLALFWSRGGHNEEAIGWFKRALAEPPMLDAESKPFRRLRARSLLNLGILSLQQEVPEALAILQESVLQLRALGEKTDLAVALAVVGFLGELDAAQESVALARTLNNKWILAYCLAWQSQALRLTGGDLGIAEQAAAESTRLARELHSDWAMARSMLSQGQIAAVSGQPDEARAYLEETMALFSRSQDSYHANMARNALAGLARQQGDYDEAIRLYQATILVWQDWGLQSAIAHELEQMALICAAQGRLQHAVRLSGAATRLRMQTGTQPLPNERMEFEASLAAVRQQMDASEYDALWQEGVTLSTSEAIAYAEGLPLLSRS